MYCDVGKAIPMALEMRLKRKVEESTKQPQNDIFMITTTAIFAKGSIQVSMYKSPLFAKIINSYAYTRIHIV